MMSGSLLLAARACARSVAEAVAQPARLRVSSARCGCSRRFYVQPTTTTTPATAHTQNPMTGGGAEHEKRLKDFFGAYDLNGDGEITREELFKAMKRAIGYNDVATNQIVDAIYSDCQKKEGEKITFEDFKKGIKIVSY